MAEKTASVLTDDIQNKVNVKLQSVRRTVVPLLFIFTICNYMYIITESVKKREFYSLFCKSTKVLLVHSIIYNCSI